MKIAFVYDAIYPWIKGGVEKRVYEVGKRLAGRGHEVHWYGIRWWEEDETAETAEKDGIVLHGVVKPVELYKNGRRTIREAISFSQNLLLPILKEKFDILDCQSFPYFSCISSKFHSLIRGSNLVITWHEVWGDYWYEYLGVKGFIGGAVEKVVARLTDKNIAVSNKTKRDLERFGVKVAAIVPNGIDFEKIRDVKASEMKSDVIFVGRLIKEKNVDVLLKAISLLREEMRDVSCIIVGDGPERERLMKLARDLKVEGNVAFLRFLDNHETVISLMKSSKVFVLPSTREGFGITVLEANACGIPVVTIDSEMNAAADLVKGGTGFLSELDAGDIGSKIKLAIERGKTMRKVCIKSSRKYDWDDVTGRLESFYTSVVSG